MVTLGGGPTIKGGDKGRGRGLFQAFMTGDRPLRYAVIRSTLRLWPGHMGVRGVTTGLFAGRWRGSVLCADR